MKTASTSLIFEQTEKTRYNYWPIFLGLTGVICGFFLYRYRNKNQDDDKISIILRLLNSSFKEAEPELCPLASEKTSEISDHNIKIKINFISKLEKKNKITVSSTSNPFFPPFPKGMMITDLPPSHRLLFNKFYFYKNHLLVVTQSFQDQLKRLSVQDLRQSFLILKALNGMFFFNSGPESGFSQKHKHIQILPQQAKQLPIVAKILQDISSSKLGSIKFQNKDIYFFRGYQFLHGIVLFSENISKKYLQIEDNELKEAENTLFEYLSVKLKAKQAKFSYNVIGCEKFMLMIPRKQQKTIYDVPVNAILFMGSMLVKDQAVFQRIQKFCKPTDLLNQVSFSSFD